ncbi:MAG: TonB-dependent receptor [Acidobacteria bacterium]|nr:TonB-dependent receptor [Acidobacteriota bacterium]
MSSPIKFGTSGWRAVIAEDFTLANVKKAVEAVARHVTSTNPARPSRSGGPSLIVGYDTRFLSEKFAAMSAELLASHGIHCYLSQQAVPTPAIACAIRRLKTDGAINFTASHNPSHYNGVKFSTPDGAPAMTGVTQKVEAWLSDDTPAPLPEKPAAVETVDLQPAYLEEIAQKVNLDLIRSAGLRLACDPLYGAGIGYIDGLLAQAGIEAVSVHNWRDVLFGGRVQQHISLNKPTFYNTVFPRTESMAAYQTSVLDPVLWRGLGAGGALRSIVGLTQDSLTKFSEANRSPGNATGNFRDAGNFWNTIEDTYAAYGQVNFETGRLSGDVGLRYAKTVNEQTYRSTLDYEPWYEEQITIKRGYDDWLPSFNAAYELTDDIKLRAAATPI